MNKLQSQFKIRKATYEDIGILSVFSLAVIKEGDGISVPSEHVKPGIEAVLKDETKGFYLVASQQDNLDPIGCLMITFEWSDVNNGFYWWIQSVYVDPTLRRMGVYSALHKHVVNLAKSYKNVSRIKLYVHETNTRAQTTYRTMGMNEAPHKIFEFYL
mgnify:FL=1